MYLRQKIYTAFFFSIIFCSVKVFALTPEEVYKTYCVMCHGMTSTAPQFRVAEDWEKPLSQGMGKVYENAIKGLAAHPPRGLCALCSDQEIIDATDYMIGIDTSASE